MNDALPISRLCREKKTDNYSHHQFEFYHKYKTSIKKKKLNLNTSKNILNLRRGMLFDFKEFLGVFESHV